MTLAAMRRASSTSRGSVAASVRLSPSARRIVVFPRWCAWSLRASANPRFQLPDYIGNGAAFGARGKCERHAVLKNRLGEIEYIVDRGCQTTVEQRAGANREHQRLAGARARSPGDQLASLAAFRARTRRPH